MDYEAKTKPVVLFGGTSYHTSQRYNLEIHNEVNARLGGLHCANLRQIDYDFDEITRLMQAGEWKNLALKYAKDLNILCTAGITDFAIASNTLHKIIPAIQQRIDDEISVIHVGDSIIRELPACARRVLLLGTNFTMTEDFMTSHLCKANYEAVVPEEDDRNELDRIIFQELCKDGARSASVEWFMEMVLDTVINRKVDAVILGCTELPLLVNPEEFGGYIIDHLPESMSKTEFPVIDSAAAHINHIVARCII